MRPVLRPARRRIAAAAAILVLAAFLVGGLLQTEVRTDLRSFLPVDDPALERYDEVSRSFGGDPVVVLVRGHRPGELVDSAHILPLLGLEGALSRLPDVAVVYGPGTALNTMAGQAQLLVAELAGRRDGIRSRAEREAKADGLTGAAVRKAGDEAVAAFDVRYGKLMVQALPSGLPTLRNPGFVRAAALDAQGQPRPQWRHLLPADDTAAILVRPRQGLDEAATTALVSCVRAEVAKARLDVADFRVSGVPAIVSGLGEQVRREVSLLGAVAVLAVAACFLLVPWTRWRRRLMPVATTVVAIGLTVAAFGWLGKPISLGVVAFLPVLLGIGSYYPSYFAQRASRRTVLAVVAATAASFATLAFTPLPFVRDLGIAMAIGVLASAAIGLAVLGRGRGEDAPSAATASATVGSTTWRRARIAVGALVVAAGFGWAALPSLPVEGSLDRLTEGLPAMADARHTERVLGASGELDIALTGGDVLSPKALAWARQAQNVAVARHGDRLRPVVTPSNLLSFLGPRPTEEQIAAGVRLLPRYLSGAALHGNKVALLSFGVRLDDIGSLQRLRDDLTRSLPEPPPGFSAEITGLPMVAVRGNELLSADKAWGNVAGIVAAGAVLAVALRRGRRSDAARAVASAAIATGAGLALLWAAGIPLSPLTVALGSLTAAVGCEFTVVLAESARRRSTALRRSVVLAAASSAVGYAVLAVSSLSAVAEFGLLLAGAVLLSLAVAWCVVTATTARAPGQEPEEIRPHEKIMVGVS